MVMRATAIVRTKSMRIERLGQSLRRAFDLHQGVDRHAFGMGGQGGQRMDQADAVVGAFAHADNAAAADIDAGVAHMLQRIQPVLIGPGADDVAVIFRRGVEIVVVVIQPRLLSAARACGAVSMPSVTQVSIPSALTPSTMAQTASRSLSLGERQAAPMQKRDGARRLGGAGIGQHGFDLHQLGGLQAGVVLRRLAAIAAILRAAAGLDRQQGRDLHLAGIEMGPVHALRRGTSVPGKGRANRAAISSRRPVGARGGRAGHGRGRSWRHLRGVPGRGKRVDGTGPKR